MSMVEAFVGLIWCNCAKSIIRTFKTFANTDAVLLSNIKFVKFEEEENCHHTGFLLYSDSNLKVQSKAKFAKEWHGNYKTAWQENSTLLAPQVVKMKMSISLSGVLVSK